MAYTAWSVVYGEQPTAAKWNQLGTNDAGFKDGTNIDTDAIIERHIKNGEVTAAKLGVHSAMGVLSLSGGTGNKAVSGLGFQPSFVSFMGFRSSSGQYFGGGWGFMNASIQRAYGGQIGNGIGSGGDNRTDSCYLFADQGGTTITRLTRTSLDADGFTVNAVAISAISEVIYMAHK